MTAAAFAPAEPSGISVAPMSWATRAANDGGRLRLTTIRSGWANAGPPAWPVRGGAGGSAVLRTRFRAGSATAPAVSSPRSHSATCTAQSLRPGSPYSLVPSSGSTIHTRSAASRAGSSRPSSERMASPGQRLASCADRNSWELASPALRNLSGSPPAARRASRRWPAASARSRAVLWSSARIGLAPLPGDGPAGEAHIGPHRLVSAGTVGNRRESLPEDLQVKGEGPVLHVTQVEPFRLVPGQIRPTADLPQAGDARLDRQPAPHMVPVLRHLDGQRRAGPDQRHVAEQDVEQLRKLVQRPPAQPGTGPGDPWVPVQLEQRPIPVVLRQQLRLPRLGVHHHGPELPHAERLPILAGPGLPEEDGPAIGDLYGESDQHEQGGQEQDGQQGRDPVKDLLDHLLAAGQLGVVHVQQRQPRNRPDGGSWPG